MRILLGIAIVLVVTAIGGAIPFMFRDRLGSFVGTAMVCDVLAIGVKLGHLDADKRKSLIEAVVASSDTDAKSKAIVEQAKSGCR
jgi:hypothetical protein